MEVPHYSYLVLKKPTKKGILTLGGNVYTTYTCEEKSFKLIEAIDLSVHMKEIVIQANKTPTDQLEIPELQIPHKILKSKEHEEI
jgi:hypothetical protein